MTVTVTYVPGMSRLTKRYLFRDGSAAANTFTDMMKTGDAYEIPSPAIKGYKPVYLKISGNKEGKDEKFTVIYLPEEYPEVVTIDDYDTPTYLETTHIQMGICFE